MRIEGPKRTGEVRKNEKTKKSGSVSGSFSTFLEGDADDAAPAGAAPKVSDVSSLLAVQAADDPTERKARKAMTQRAERVLDALEGVHRGLVTGGITLSQMRDVSRAIAEKREKLSDPALLGILDEVELRAQVELAKLEMARDKNNK